MHIVYYARQIINIEKKEQGAKNRTLWYSLFNFFPIQRNDYLNIYSLFSLFDICHSSMILLDSLCFACNSIELQFRQ